MQKYKHRKKRLKLETKLVLLGVVLLLIVSAWMCVYKKSQELSSTVAIATPQFEVITTDVILPANEQYVPSSEDVTRLAQMLWGEARGISSDTEKAACVWCVLNRIDDTGNVWPDSVADVLSQKNQFVGYSQDYPAPDNLKALAADVLTRWHQEKLGTVEVGRVLPANYFFFTGDGRTNHFRADYRDTEIWDWSLSSPYES